MSRAGIPKRNFIKRCALRNISLFEHIIESILIEQDVQKKVEELNKFRFAVVILSLFAESERDSLNFEAVTLSMQPYEKFAHLIDWVLMFEVAYDIPFHEWEDIAPQCLKFLELQWRQGPISFEDFYEGEYDIKGILQQRKDQLSEIPEYQALFLREG